MLPPPGSPGARRRAKAQAGSIFTPIGSPLLEKHRDTTKRRHPSTRLLTLQDRTQDLRLNRPGGAWKSPQELGLQLLSRGLAAAPRHTKRPDGVLLHPSGTPRLKMNPAELPSKSLNPRSPVSCDHAKTRGAVNAPPPALVSPYQIAKPVAGGVSQLSAQQELGTISRGAANFSVDPGDARSSVLRKKTQGSPGGWKLSRKS